MGTPPIRVAFKGEGFTFTEIAKSCDDPTITREIVYDRWKKMKRPMVLSQEDYSRLIRKMEADLFSRSDMVIEFNGKEITCGKLADLYEVSVNTIYRKARKHSYILEPEDMCFRKDVSVRKLPVGATPPVIRKEETLKPGWAERKYFPNTGKNGFFGGKGESDYPVKVVKQ